MQKTTTKQLQWLQNDSRLVVLKQFTVNKKWQLMRLGYCIWLWCDFKWMKNKWLRISVSRKEEPLLSNVTKAHTHIDHFSWMFLSDDNAQYKLITHRSKLVNLLANKWQEHAKDTLEVFQKLHCLTHSLLALSPSLRTTSSRVQSAATWSRNISCVASVMLRCARRLV